MGPVLLLAGLSPNPSGQEKSLSHKYARLWLRSRLTAPRCEIPQRNAQPFPEHETHLLAWQGPWAQPLLPARGAGLSRSWKVSGGRCGVATGSDCRWPRPHNQATVGRRLRPGRTTRAHRSPVCRAWSRRGLAPRPAASLGSCSSPLLSHADTGGLRLCKTLKPVTSCANCQELRRPYHCGIGRLY